MTEGRDEDLGRRIASLPTPDHGRDFWSRLDARLAEETVDEVGERRARRNRGWQGLLPLVTVAALIVALLGYVGTRSSGNEPVDEERVDTTPASNTTSPSSVPVDRVPQVVSGVVEVLERSDRGSALEATQEYTFVRVADGSYALRNTATDEFMGYDAAQARTVSWFTFDGKTSATIETNVAPGAPDRYPYSFVGGHDVEDFVVSAALDDHPDVREQDVLGRDAWTYDGPVNENEIAGNGVNGLEITVDQETGVLLRLVEKAGDVPVREVAVRTFEVDGDVSRSSLLPEPPAGSDVQTTDQAFRRVSVDELATVGVIPPLYPERRADSPFGPPEPFELDSVWVNVKGGGITGAEGSNPGSARVASLLYRDEWRRVIVTLRALNGPPDNWSDPFGGEGQRLGDSEELVLEGDGAFPGAEGVVVVDPQTVPHAWAISCGKDCTAANDWPGYVLTVAGAASRAELRQFATVARAA